MRKIDEALRLQAEGRSVREIAAGIGAGKTTVAEYLRRAQAAGISWPPYPRTWTRRPSRRSCSLPPRRS